jgi:hypothetical protein
MRHSPNAHATSGSAKALSKKSSVGSTSHRAPPMTSMPAMSPSNTRQLDHIVKQNKYAMGSQLLSDSVIESVSQGIEHHNSVYVHNTIRSGVSSGLNISGQVPDISNNTAGQEPVESSAFKAKREQVTADRVPNERAHKQRVKLSTSVISSLHYPATRDQNTSEYTNRATGVQQQIGTPQIQVRGEVH